MNKNIEDIDSFFKEPIEAYTEMPADTVWKNIENNFDKTSHNILKKRYQNLRKIAAVLLLLLCGTVFYMISKRKALAIANSGNNTAIENKTVNENKNLPSENTVNFNKKKNEVAINLKNNERENFEKQHQSTKIKSIIGKAKSSISAYGFEKSTSSNIVNILEDEYLEKNKKATSKNKMNLRIKNATSDVDSLESSNSNGSEDFIAWEINQFYKLNNAKSSINSSISVPFLPTLRENNISKIASKKLTTPYKFSATIYASPEFAFNRLEDDELHQDRMPLPPNPARPREDRDKIKREERKLTSFSAGILVDYAFNKKISLQTGVGFSSKSDEISPKKVFAEQNANGEVKYKNNSSFGATYVDPKTGVTTTVGDSTNLGETKNTVQYISLPLNILYHFQLGKFQVSPTLGIAANFLVNQKVTTNVEGGTIQKINTIEGLNNNYFNANIGVGLDYKLAKNFSLSCTPNVRIGLNSLNKNSNVKLYSNTAGVMLGVKYGF